MVEKPWFLVEQPIVQLVIPLFSQFGPSQKKVAYNFLMILWYSRHLAMQELKRFFQNFLLIFVSENFLLFAKF